METPVTIEPSFDPAVHEYTAHYQETQEVKATATPYDNDAVSISIKAGTQSRPDIKINPNRINGNTVQLFTVSSGSSTGVAGLDMPFFITFQATFAGTAGQPYKVNIVSA